jgi:hypothetical protein
MSASRWSWRLAVAAAVSRSTSSVVRCSLVRSSALGRRTVRFTVVGEVAGEVWLSMRMASLGGGTVQG